MPHAQLIIPNGHRRKIRTLRAVWRDTSALWREFRRPILTFLAAVFAGGWVYGELLVVAGYERVAYLALPYMMGDLMILQNPTEIPPEPYLIAFWYAMPLIALYVVGRGISDFVRLFFNRGERRSAWEEAVVSTYRNHIIVMGIGHVGLRVVRALEAIGSEVVAIDLDEPGNPLPDMSTLKTALIEGDGRSAGVLEKAGVRYAEALIICTANDFINLEVCVRAREMNPTMRIVVRMWDTQLSNHLKKSLNAETLSASDLAAPAFAGLAVGANIAPMMQVRDTAYSLIRLQIEPGSFMDGSTIAALQDENEMDIVLFERNDQVKVHPEGNLPVCAGDILVLFAKHTQIMQIVARNRRQA
ncbi:MAG: NAD-binding protein [Chloroflexota bacterium]